MLTLVIAGTLCMVFNIAPALGQEESTLYIYHDYTFTHDIYEPIVVCASEIVIDGNGYKLKGPGWTWDAGIFLGGPGIHHVTIKNVVIEGWYYGIHLSHAYGFHTLSGNTILNNVAGIYLEGLSRDNTIRDSLVSDNMIGIWFDNSHRNTISDNVISDNWSKGILAFNCRYNTWSGNTIARNWIGIELSSLCRDELIYHNNIVDNELTQAVDIMADSDWYHPELLEGNYWSDYLGVDDGSGTGKHAVAGDLIGDTDIPWPEPYMDNYPLMLTWIADPVEETHELIETIESWNLPAGTENALTLKLDAAISLLNGGNINGAIHKLDDFIKQVEAQRGKKLTEAQADCLIQTAQAIIFAIS